MFARFFNCAQIKRAVAFAPKSEIGMDGVLLTLIVQLLHSNFYWMICCVLSSTIRLSLSMHVSEMLPSFPADPLENFL